MDKIVRRLTPAEEQEVLTLLRAMAHEFAVELMTDQPISGADFFAAMEPVLDLLTIELEEEEDASPHDLECCVCGVTLNNQCLDPQCGEEEDHPTNEVCT